MTAAGLEIAADAVTRDDAAALAGFRAGTLAEFPHREHVRVAWLYARASPFEDALVSFCRDLRAFAAARGAHGLFHTTITWAFFAVIADRLRDGETFDAFATRNPDLLRWKPSVLDRYYTKERLDSPEARARFVLPDRGGV